MFWSNPIPWAKLNTILDASSKDPTLNWREQSDEYDILEIESLFSSGVQTQINISPIEPTEIQKISGPVPSLYALSIFQFNGLHLSILSPFTDLYLSITLLRRSQNNLRPPCIHEEQI